jgi:hypothetical protein
MIRCISHDPVQLSASAPRELSPVLMSSMALRDKHLQIRFWWIQMEYHEGPELPSAICEHV